MKRPEFRISVVLETDKESPIADLEFGGDQLGSVCLEEGELALTIFDRFGDGERRVPLDGFIRALQVAAERFED